MWSQTQPQNVHVALVTVVVGGIVPFRCYSVSTRLSGRTGVDEHLGISRKKGILYVVGAAWLLGIFSIMSLGDWSTYYPLNFIPSYDGKNIFNALDHLAANNLLLLGGAWSAIFFGWLVPKALKLEELDVADGPLFALWHFMIRFVIPPVLVIVLAGVFLEL